jgi:hypothetical protein
MLCLIALQSFALNSSSASALIVDPVIMQDVGTADAGFPAARRHAGECVSLDAIAYRHIPCVIIQDWRQLIPYCWGRERAFSLPNSCNSRSMRNHRLSLKHV